ncbi:MAG: yccA [Gammaproteobacteria bacterium]|jgi:modulator of FtsH protease|nr:yccA [Gammaproteobacteria bacterium]
MQPNNYSVVRTEASVLATNKVLRNTYLLLGATFVFSALCAAIAMLSNVTLPGGFSGLLIMIIGMYGLLFLTVRLRNSPWGLLSVFAFTGFMGFILGPLLNLYLQTFSNGAELIMTALGGTGIIFFGLSAYALSTRKDFSYMGGFLFVAILVAVLASLAAVIFGMPLLQLAVSAAFVLICSGLILFHTSQIIHGGETNYIMATISLYIALYNMFVSLLQILSAFSGNRD